MLSNLKQWMIYLVLHKTICFTKYPNFDTLDKLFKRKGRVHWPLGKLMLTIYFDMPTHEKYCIVFLQTHIPTFAFEPSHKNKIFQNQIFKLLFETTWFITFFWKSQKLFWSRWCLKFGDVKLHYFQSSKSSMTGLATLLLFSYGALVANMEHYIRLW